VFVCMNTVFIYIGTKWNMCTNVFPVFGVPVNIYRDQYAASYQLCKISVFSHSFEVSKFPLAVKHIF